MKTLLILFVWAHLGFVITLGIHSKCRIEAHWREERYRLGVLAAGPIVWLLALGSVRRAKPRLSNKGMRSL
ncbi:hypothetical protein [Halomonas sp. WWR20]